MRAHAYGMSSNNYLIILSGLFGPSVLINPEKCLYCSYTILYTVLLCYNTFSHAYGMREVCNLTHINVSSLTPYGVSSLWYDFSFRWGISSLLPSAGSRLCSSV